MQEKDVNGKVLLNDPLLYSQFVRDNITDIPLLKNVQPEDIEDVTAEYQTFMGSEYKADLVKKIQLKRLLMQSSPEISSQTWNRVDEELAEKSIYLVFLVEHKSQVDFDVAMQLLRYMVCIWSQYAKEMNQEKQNASRQKDFRYPPILPIVYYEGKKKWTAAPNLLNRVFMSETFGKYMPDFNYRLVRIHDYSDEELLSREDEMSFLMMINKIQTAKDLSCFLKAKSEIIDRIVQRAPESVITILTDTISSLCRRLNVPETETQECVEIVRRRDMGYLFENMEKMDIQAERKKTEEAHRKAEEAQKAADEAQKAVVMLCKKFKRSKQEAAFELQTECNLSQESAEKIVEKNWK